MKALRIQPNVIVLDADAQASARNYVSFRIEYEARSGAMRLWGSRTYLAAVVAGERSLSGGDLPGRHAPHYRYLLRMFLAELGGLGVDHTLIRARRRKLVLVFGDRSDYSDDELQALTDRQSRTAAQWCALWAGSPRAATRRMVAFSANTSAETLAVLADDRSVLVRRAVARHPAVADEAVLKICKDEDPKVRGALLWRDQLPADALMLLMADKDALVRAIARRHPSCPPEYQALVRISDLAAPPAPIWVKLPRWWPAAPPAPSP